MRKWNVKLHLSLKKKTFLKRALQTFLGEIFNFFYENIFEVLVFVEPFLSLRPLTIKMNTDVLP